MKIETQPQENHTVKIVVEVEDERVQPALRAAARRMAKDYRIPGFRPGKAPYEVMVRHVGEGAIYQAALEDLSQAVYKEALEEQKIEPGAPGELEDFQLKPLVLTYTVPLAPEVDLGDYRALRVPYEGPTVSDEAVQEQMDRLREREAVMEPVERAAQMGDVVTLDAKGYLNTGENPSDFLMADENTALALEENADWPMPGFAQEIVGLAAGEARKFDLAFPDDYANETLRGQTAHFEVTVKEVKSRTLPEWDDELAKSVGDYEGLEDLRRQVREALQQRAEQGVKSEYADKVVDELTAQAKVTFPPVLLENELDSYLDDLDKRLREQRLTLDDYLKIEGKSKEQLREEARPNAEQRLKRSLVLGEILSSEGIHVHAEEVEAQIELMAARFGDRAGEMRKLLNRPETKQAMATDLLTNKALERITAIARGEEVPPPGEAGHDHEHDHAEEAPAEGEPALAGAPAAEAEMESTAPNAPLAEGDGAPE